MNTRSAAGRCSGGDLAGETMHRAAADGRDVIERAGEHVLKFLFAARDRRQPELAVAARRAAC